MAKQRVVEIKATRTRKDGKSKGTLKRVEQKDLIKEKVESNKMRKKVEKKDLTRKR